VLSLYAVASTTVAFSATGGVMAATATGNSSAFPGTAPTTSTTAIAFTKTQATSGTAHTAAVLWEAPTTSGTYDISLYIAAAPGTSSVTPNSTNPLLGTLIGSVSVTVSTGSHPAVGGTNSPVTTGPTNSSLFVAIASNTGASAIAHPTTTLGTDEDTALSKGILNKDSTYGTAQTATVLTGAVLSLYAQISTTVAFSSSGGSFSGSAGATTATYSTDLKTTLITGALSTARKTAATLWTAPSTAGTYTISLFKHDGITAPTLAAPNVALAAKITVSVVASSAGGSYSAAYSACNISPAVSAITAGAGTAGIDNTVVFNDGDAAYINYDLNDAYNADLGAGNIVITATNGALVNGGTSSIAAGTASTDTELVAPTGRSVRIDQGTSGAPVTTTVTISYNGSTVCTKTITIRGKVAALTVSNVGVQNLNAAYTADTPQWSYQKTGTWITGGSLFSVQATDSAGNVVKTDTTGTFSSVASTLTTTVPALAVNTTATTNTASSASSFAYGSWNCGASAGSSSVKVKYTITATGEAIESPAFTARCAGNASGGSYKVSMDKAAYTLGDLAKVTVAFVDSRGNPVNTVGAVGANTWSLPYLTGVDLASGLGANAASSTAVTNADGTITYTLTVGTTSTAVTAGTYTGIVDFSVPALGTKATPTYKLSTGGDSTTNADVLKSIVALIASINKQIQALQKLILRR
jgi:hypothetical protein